MFVRMSVSELCITGLRYIIFFVLETLADTLHLQKLMMSAAAAAADSREH